jgi:hypothetical protein
MFSRPRFESGTSRKPIRCQPPCRDFRLSNSKTVLRRRISFNTGSTPYPNETQWHPCPSSCDNFIRLAVSQKFYKIWFNLRVSTEYRWNDNWQNKISHKTCNVGLTSYQIKPKSIKFLRWHIQTWHWAMYFPKSRHRFSALYQARNVKRIHSVWT